MTFRFRFITCQILVALISLPLAADDTPEPSQGAHPDDIFARQGGVFVTHAEIDGQFSKIPPDIRLRYIRDGERVSQMIQNLLRAKLVAADARAEKYDENPEVKSRMLIAAENELAEAWSLKLVEDAPEADYAILANEYYLANPDKFMTDSVVDVSHILVNNEDRSGEEALELALSLRVQLLEDPARFEDMVMEFSDDPSKGANRGRFPRMKKGEMTKPFENAAFSLENIGAITEPVETGYGYHLIMLNNKYPARLKPYEDVQEDAEAQARQQYLAEYRSRYLRKLLSDPISLSDGALDSMTRKYFGDNLELAPDYQD